MTCVSCDARVSVGVRCVPCAKQLAAHRDALNAEYARRFPSVFREPDAGLRRRGRSA